MSTADANTPRPSVRRGNRRIVASYIDRLGRAVVFKARHTGHRTWMVTETVGERPVGEHGPYDRLQDARAAIERLCSRERKWGRA